jgi:WD40 repeat protein
MYSVSPISNSSGTKVYAGFNLPSAGIYEVNNQASVLRTIDTNIDWFLASEFHQVFDLSPDGTMLCYVRICKYNVADSSGDSIMAARLQLARKDLTSGKIFSDTTSVEDADDISWSPNGDKIAYITNDPSSPAPIGGKRIAIFDVASGKTTLYDIPQLQTTYGTIWCIEWSKDEQAIYFSAWLEEGQTLLFTLKPATAAISTFNFPHTQDQVYNIPGVFRSRDIGEH